MTGADGCLLRSRGVLSPELLLVLVVFVAFVVEAAAGFGATLITVTLGAHLLPIDAVLATFLPVNLALSAYVAGRHRRLIAWRLLLGGILPWMGLGLALGMALSWLKGETWLKVVFAAFVVALAAVELWRMRRAGDAGSGALRPSIRAGVLGAAGVIHGLFACGGPMVVYVAGREVQDKGAFRSTLSALWLVLNTALCVSYAAGDQITAATLGRSAALVAPLLLGIIGGEWAHARAPERRFRVGVFALLLVAGAALLARSLGERGG